MKNKIAKTLLTGALYIRVSTHEQDELSPDAQIRLCIEFAKKNGIIIPKEFIFVESVSGRSASNRKEFQRMISIAKSGEHPIDVIVVWKFSRFARNQEESIVYKSMLKKDNIDVVSVSEPLVDGPFGSLIERIIEWMDEYYSIRLSDEVLRGMKEKALRGGYQYAPPLGYKAVGGGKPFVIDEENFKTVAYIFDQYDNHNNDFFHIARELNKMGRLTQRKRPFEARSIRRILQNPFYYGLVAWNGTEFIGTHEVRLTKEQFDERMDKMERRRRPAKHRNVSTCTHWLSGIMKCGICGATMVYNGVGSHPGFQCYRYSKGLHEGSMYIIEWKVIDAVLIYFEQLLNGEDFEFDYQPPASSENSFQAASLEDELKRLDAKEARIRLAYENEIDTLEEYKENKKRIQESRLELQEKLDKINSDTSSEKPSKDVVLERIHTVYDVIKNPDVDKDTKGNFIRSIVKEIVFDKANGQMIFTLFYS